MVTSVYTVLMTNTYTHIYNSFLSATRSLLRAFSVLVMSPESVLLASCSLSPAHHHQPPHHLQARPPEQAHQ